MTIWLLALIATTILAFWAGLRFERARRNLQDGMDATLDAIDHDRRIDLELSELLANTRLT